ncbi:MAG: hypothetical protein JWN48_2911 [Myxococcaceae bacterium]|nr:hypothetical protein [Myxococcaceae bacterium]
MEALVRRVIALETRELHSIDDIGAALDGLFSRVHGLTAAMIGDVGYLALLERSLLKTEARFPALASTAARGSPIVWKPLAERAGAEAASAFATALLIDVLSLLASFIGDDFVLRLLYRRWPALRDSRKEPPNDQGIV